MQKNNFFFISVACAMLLVGCSGDGKTDAAVQGAVNQVSAPVAQQAQVDIVSVAPNKTQVGVKFTQYQGTSAFTVSTKNATPTCVIMWDNVELKSAVGNSGVMTALIPDELIATAGTHSITVVDKKTNQKSANSVPFQVQ